MIVELSSGHVFASGSVKSIGPLQGTDKLYCDIAAQFDIIGVGFQVRVQGKAWVYKKEERLEDHQKIKLLREEAINKLLSRS